MVIDLPAVLRPWNFISIAYFISVEHDGKQSPRQPDAWKEAEAAGIDMSLLEANLRRSFIERIRAHDRALNTALALRKAVRDQTNRS